MPTGSSTYRNLLLGWIASAKGVWPASNGLPATGVNKPVVRLIEYTETLSMSFNPLFATYANRPATAHVTLIDVTLAAATVPVPPDTVQTWRGVLGCVVTVTLYEAP